MVVTATWDDLWWVECRNHGLRRDHVLVHLDLDDRGLGFEYSRGLSHEPFRLLYAVELLQWLFLAQPIESLEHTAYCWSMVSLLFPE
jgi:hypothetical protein